MRTVVPKTILILPCFNEEQIIKDSADKITNELNNLIEKKLCNENSFILFVDDGSLDDTWQIIKNSSKNNLFLKGIKLNQNKGHQTALMAGITEAVNNCDLAITVDADLQDDISKIKNMLNFYMEGYDVVCGVKKTRKVDKLSKRIFANIFYFVMKIFGLELIKNHADFRLMSSRILKKIIQYNENNLFIRGLIPVIDKNYKIIEYDLLPRKKSQPKYNFTHSLSLGLSAITSFSLFPLRLISITGFVIFFISIILAIKAFYNAIAGEVVPGWASITIPLYALGGILILSLGIVGEYIGKIFLEVKKRPQYIISDKI